MKPFLFALSCLATYRVTVLLVLDKGPWEIFAKMRSIARFTKLLTCVFCTSLWVAALVCVGLYFAGTDVHPVHWVLYLLSFSAVTIMLHMAFTQHIKG